MYSRQVGDRVLSFGVSGKLTRNTLIMYDRETDSLWPQVLGEAIDGPLTGQNLEFVPAVHTTWAAWRAEHPQTLALVKGYSGDSDSYAGYYASGRTGVLGETYIDDRLYAKEFVIGVILDDTQIAYPFGTLNAQPVVNDDVGTHHLLVVFDPNTGGGSVFDRRVAGQTLTFAAGPGGALVDEETATRWNRITGVAEEGPLAGQQLAPIKFTRIFWFAWKDWYPDAVLFGGDAAGAGS